MKKVLSSWYTKPLTIYLAAALIAISTLAGPAEAMLLPADRQAVGAGHAVPSAERAADLARIQKALESKELQQRLQDYGLTSEEASARIDRLSDEQVHQLAANMDALQPGGDVLGAVFGLALIALLVVLIIYLLEGRIEIRSR